MSDNQDTQPKDQKSIAPFIIGLAIGGILIWIFAVNGDATPEEENNEGNTNTNNAVVSEEGTEVMTEESETESPATESAPETGFVPNSIVTDGTGFVMVENQPAGNLVLLKEVQYPAQRGWIVVHEDNNGQLGNALGAARFGDGLDPREVELLRNTTPSEIYHVVLYSEDGDKIFNLKVDRPFQNEASGDIIRSQFRALINT